MLLGGVLAGPAYAQVTEPVDPGAYRVTYRPDVQYQVWETPHYDIIYQGGAADMARRTAAALEATRAGTDSLVGTVGESARMPVVVNDFTDRSNGVVSPFPFRQEIETPSIKSAPLVARARSWPALVAPHEQVHAAHAEVDGTVGVGSLVRLFAPDMARAINLFAPPGLIEGAAVYRESRLNDRSGRLHAPLFTMKMKAAMLSDDPWSLTQMLEAPAYTQPFNRFYIGGAHAFEYLAERGDSTSTQFFRTAVTMHNRLPVLGHAVWLSAGTGQFPNALRSELRTQLAETYRADLTRRAPFTRPTLVAGEPGLNHRRPYWLDDETLVAYVHGYDVRPGFYRVDARTGRRTPIRVQQLTEDRTYSLAADTSALLAARYVQDPWVPRQAIADVERIRLRDGAATRLTQDARAVAPAAGPDGTVYAVQNDGPFTRWGRVRADGTVTPLARDTARSVRQVAPSPTDSTIAVLVNEAGRQRIYRARRPVDAPAALTPWLGLEDAVIYDLSWGPDGRYLLFAADLHGTPNVFAYDTRSTDVLRLTNVRFGALEPALSPDRSTLAFVRYRHERHDLVRMPFRPDSAAVVPDSLVQRAFRARAAPSPPADAVGRPSDAEPQSYAAWRHLAPRMVYPVLRGEGDAGARSVVESPNPDGLLGTGVGVGLQGSDPLRRWAYVGSAYWQDGRLWGQARLESGVSRLRPSLSVYDRPFTALARSPAAGLRSVAVEERGAALGVDLPVLMRSNVYQTQLRLGLDAGVRQTRLYGPGVAAATDFTTRATLDPTLTAAYRVQQNPRDLVPNTGLVVALQGEVDAWTEAGPASRGLVTGVDAYLPFLRSTNTGLRLGARALVQNRASIFNTDTFVPRGYPDITRLPSTPFLQLEAEVTQPLWYVDDGLTLLPIYLKAVSLYGFGETLGAVDGGAWRWQRSSVGGGVSVQLRLFYQFNVDLRLGAAYRPEVGDVTAVYR
jgi:hypothetical protein